MDARSFVPPNTFSNSNDELMIITPDGGGNGSMAPDGQLASTSFSVPDPGATTSVASEGHVSEHHPDMASSMHTARTPLPVVETDLAKDIPTMYRFLDLVSEQGSGGLVDKVIIAQESLAKFVNNICPGAYVSLTDIRFKVLDRLDVKPVGVYGSMEMLVTFLKSLGVFDEIVAKKLLNSRDKASDPSLPSGLYIVNPPDQELVYIIYWPEPTTWNDNADESVKRNRITFMRYLTKITDQVIAFVSPEHLNGIAMDSDDQGHDDMDQDDDEDGRLVRFEVAKTNEQEEGVTVQPGIQIVSPLFGLRRPPQGDSFEPELFTPKWIVGETVSAFLTTEFLPTQSVENPLFETVANKVQLKNMLRTGSIVLSERLGFDAMTLLFQDGLQERFPEIYDIWINKRNAASARKTEAIKKTKEKMVGDRPTEASRTESIMRCVLASWIVKTFPVFTCEDCGIYSSNEYDSALQYYTRFLQNNPPFRSYFEHIVKNFKLPYDFTALKYRFLLVEAIFSSNQLLPGQKDIARDIILGPSKTKRAQLKERLEEVLWEKDEAPKPQEPWLLTKLFSTILRRSSSPPPVSDHDPLLYQIFRNAEAEDQRLSVTKFYSRDFVGRVPLFDVAIRAASQASQDYLRGFIRTKAAVIKDQVISIREREREEQWQAEGRNEEEAELAAVRSEVVERMKKASEAVQSSFTTIIDDFKMSTLGHYRSYEVHGRVQSQQDPLLKYGIHKLHLDSNQRDESEFDSTFVPSPKIEERLSHTFTLPVNARISYIRVLESDKVLMIVDHGNDMFAIYLESLIGIRGAIERGINKRSLKKARIGSDFLVAFNEQKRVLVICSTTKPHLHVFNIDPQFSSVKAFGSSVNLVDWYPDPTATIRHALFICGAEELLLIDSNRQARIYSFTTLQIRPSTLMLKQVPSSVYSSPDGSCFLALMPEKDGPVLRAFHWSTFGTSDGIPLDLSIMPNAQSLALSSFVTRKNVHLLVLDPYDRSCRSIVLNITTRNTQFTFTQKSARSQATENNESAHNSLIDCHSEVWTRFPVVAAVRRKTLKSSTRQKKTLTFITDHSHHAIPGYFSKTIQLFEQQTQKPTDYELWNIQVSAMKFDELMASGLISLSDKTSRFLAGEWLVDILCLIPIQIAVARDNRFIPLKDGLFSAKVEQDLLGAEVGHIVNMLSFGWYESLFQSYQSSKPVKVISSMGEQSVGKSYALNHMVDTSFAGSAMRTTEGVWMAVTPTDDALIVALDFEGVHSIERTAQEDTLLVLFNTALSNLVLFRNNFALSRDITDLFQSFRSSATVLDPAANPSLFQSTLAIIIKDVVESDKDGIVREFRSKFLQIVREEQDANFITRLHRGHVNIIPWPVIYSRQFYRLFVRLKQDLDNQPITHPAAGEFLHKMKTLMAKLKANDWGALDNNLATHRAQQLLSLLSNALKFGLGEIDPEEPLKNLDTYELIPSGDNRVQFYLPGRTPDPGAHAQILSDLRSVWEAEHPRQAVADALWVADLATYLNHLVERRIVHVQDWLTSNMSRFKVQNANTMDLQRTYEVNITALRSNVELCKMKCHHCNLLCLKSRSHDADEDHDCTTPHRCLHLCDYVDEHEMEEKGCAYPAGHSGKHICKVDSHLCGEPCVLDDKEGCLLYCTKMVDHMNVDGHMCSAPVHMCGERCSLTLIVNGKKWACPGTCKTPTHEQHTTHACENRSCPMQCQLCNRLCSNPDHFHGLDAGQLHLCGQEHSCPKLCSARGICEIQTAPQSIEATFTGRHEVFQYTKYTQVSKRLQCAISIKRGEIDHMGDHVHTLDSKPFHYCQERCVNCGYFCTLPLGHTQQEHETNHGSMASTRWAVDGADGAALELDGRRFSANDDGAPMMCNLVCQQLGRHVHIDYCRTRDGGSCNLSNEGQHIMTRLSPNPNRPKDWITHNLNWRRLGFKDPYSREQQGEFAKCDAMCPGQEHEGTAGAPAQPSHCTLPIFHDIPLANAIPPAGGYISSDGHAFTCRNPAVMQQAFHVIFVIDRSGSMSSSDRRPLPNTPVSARISQTCNDRLGAVYSALYSFWLTRQGAIGTGAARRDAYSIILFESSATIALRNDFTSTPEELLNVALRFGSTGGTNYGAALQSAQTAMTESWSTERTPVLVFLSDGECQVNDQVVQEVALAAVRLGKPLSLQTISFGLDRSSSTLRRMADIARDIQRNHDAARDPLTPAASSVESAFSVALDTVQLATTFLNIAESLRKPRGFLLA